MTAKTATSTELAPTSSQADLDFYRSLGAGAIEDLSSKDVIMPRYRLIQNTSKTGTPGKFVSSVAPDVELDVLNMVIFKISNYRVMFPEMGKGDNKPLCRSNDGKTKADPDGVGSGNCSTCPYAAWGVDAKTGAKIKSPCSEGYTYMGLVLKDDGTSEPAMISFKGSAFKPVKQYNSNMLTRGRAGIGTFCYVTSIGSDSIAGNQGRYFVPTFSMGDPFAPEDAMAMAQQYQAYKSVVTDAHLVDDSSDYSDTVSTAQASHTVDDFVNALDGNAAAAASDLDKALDF